MSFQNKAFWAKDNGCLPDGEMVYDNSSRMEPKRPHQWFLDASEPELFPNKKQAVETSNSRMFLGVPGVPNGNLSLWDNASCFQPVPGHHFTDQLFGSEPARTINFGDRNVQSIGNENLNMGRSLEEQFGNDASVALSMSQDYLGSNLYGGARKVKINQVRGPDSASVASIGQTYQAKETGSGMPLPMGHSYQVKESVSGTPISVGHSYQVKESVSGTPISMGHSYHVKEPGSGMFSNGSQNMISFSGYNEEHGFHEESETGPSGRLIGNYDLLMSQSAQSSEKQKDKELADTSAEGLATRQVCTTKPEAVPKNKTDPKAPKKLPPYSNNFPSNVKSLLSTGILDGVPVKYIAWSREELRGTIKGSGYLCGCQSCNFSKVLNAYEFERHAGCKTKHPNNHIFFENGKTIYSIVQELRTTPQNILFEVIQTVTGSPINQKSFFLWKESYQAATRELQRIYGKDETNQATQNVYS